jgi:hypothetical protein
MVTVTGFAGGARRAATSQPARLGLIQAAGGLHAVTSLTTAAAAAAARHFKFRLH